MNKPRFSLFPQYVFTCIDDITPEIVAGLGIRFLMVDLDNTIAPYDKHAPSPSAMRWIERFKENGINPYLISNSTRGERVTAFASALGISYIMNARKPMPSGLYRAMGLANTTPEASALIGDQIFTDTLAANLAGVMPILVRPIKFTNPFLAVRFCLELPFRRRGKRIKKSIATPQEPYPATTQETSQDPHPATPQSEESDNEQD